MANITPPLVSTPVATTAQHETMITVSEANCKSSQRSGSCRSKAISSIGSALAKQRAKAEAARTSMEFAQKEAEMLKRQAQINAEMTILKHEKNIAVAEAELKALEAAENDMNSQLNSFELPVDDPVQRTRAYVEQHTPDTQETTNHVIKETVPDDNSAVKTQPQPRFDTSQTGFKQSSDPEMRSPPTPFPFVNSINPALYKSSVFSQSGSGDQFSPNHILRATQRCNSNHSVGASPLNPYTPEYIPSAVRFEGTTPQPQPAVVETHSEFTRFLLKKDLILSRLINFDDCPETFNAWKSGFTSMVKDLQVSPMEEMDLLVKWLGPESSRFSRSIRAANINNPIKGLERIWERLEDRYGSPEMIESALKNKLAAFPRITNKDTKRLYELSDILSEIESIKENSTYAPLFAYFDTSSGINPIISKLPYGLQEKWTNAAIKFKRQHQAIFPPFSFFAEFIREISRAKNDPCFSYETTYDSTKQKPTAKPSVTVRKTEVEKPQAKNNSTVNPESRCPIHDTNHPLIQCRVFKQKPITERKKLLKDKGICFRCCASTSHMAKDCKASVKCTDCNSDKPPTALHINNQDSRKQPSSDYGGEAHQQASSDIPAPVTSKCTQICGRGFSGKSCGKTVLVKVYPNGNPQLSILLYAILDDQSNSTLARSEFFDHFKVTSNYIPYSLSSCSGRVNTSGRRGQDFVVESLDGSSKVRVPKLIECNEIPCVREEIPTPEVAKQHLHLRDLEKHIPPLDESASILLLIGRDVTDAHHVLDQRIGPPGSPYAQKLRLGWVIVGETCLGKVHQPDTVNVNKTHLLTDYRQSIFPPISSQFRIKEGPRVMQETDSLGSSVFIQTQNDDKIGPSVEDREFLDLMDREFSKIPGGNWTAPLPFRNPRPRLPNNRAQAAKRAHILHNGLIRNPTKAENFLTFMKGILDNGHAERAPPLKDGEECWYLPVFGVYHPQKPGQIRAVFDSSAQHQGLSLNNVLLSGPNLTNSLIGVLLRFRNEVVGVTADIQQMFYCFQVREDHRNYLRFLWYKDNKLSEPLIEYRMTVHVFGNSPSPAVATYGLQKAAQQGEETYGTDTRHFVENDFYVDDALTSLPTPSEAVSLIQRTQEALKSEGNIRLHKIASNSVEVMNSFPSADHAKEFKDLDLAYDNMPTQRSLGLIWDLSTDSFSFKVSCQEKPYTRRGILSTINSLYDPLGFVAPVLIRGKLQLRDLMSEPLGWDEPLPEEYRSEWESWRDSLNKLETVKVKRPYETSSNLSSRELHIFSEASEKAIAAVAYLKTTDRDCNVQIGFVLGKAKVGPTHCHTIPRLELCAAVLAVEISETVCDQLDISLNTVHFYTDSRVVLGYIHNRTRRFYVYVSNRIDRIRKSSSPTQWKYVPTQSNPADQGTRSVPANSLNHSMWLLGSSVLTKETDTIIEQGDKNYLLHNPDEDKEVRPDVTTCVTQVNKGATLGSKRFDRFSCWERLVRGITYLHHIAESFHSKNICKGWHMCSEYRDVTSLNKAETFILREIQHDVYSTELSCIRNSQSIPMSSPLISLNPILDNYGLLRVGGRLSNSDLDFHEMHPIIIPGRHHVATLLVRYYHQRIKHQGRHFTEGAIRSAGFWVVGGKRLISSVIHSCVTCKKLRGKFEQQKMSDLPADRIKPAPPFTYVGVDMFGPWNVTTRRTRGGQANSKRWAALFTCLVTRAVHIEVVEEMTTSSFINALRRFIALRGNVQEFRSDRGTNFIGSTDPLGINAVNTEEGPVNDFLTKSRSRWIFNAPHSSHMGGVWERMIGIARRILDAMLAETSSKQLTHDVLVTFMAEICAIINSRPIVPVSNDSELPTVLTPSTLLTHKTDHSTMLSVDINPKDMYRSQWKHVQSLANTFWSRWKQDYLQSLQPGRKWNSEEISVKNGDVVLLKDKTVHRNEWTMGIIQHIIPSGDHRIRKAEVKTFRNGNTTCYIRPISEMVVLLSQ